MITIPEFIARVPMDRLIYLGCPYSHEQERIRERRYEAVCRATAELALAGFCVYSPIAHWHAIAKFESLPTTWEFWERQDTAVLVRCDVFVVLCLAGWRESTGLTAETEIMARLKRPIFHLEPRPREKRVAGAHRRGKHDEQV